MSYKSWVVGSSIITEHWREKSFSDLELDCAWLPFYYCFEYPLILSLYFVSNPWFPVCSPPDLLKTFSSGICREGETLQFSDIKEGINNYSKVGHLKNSAIEQIWTLSTSLYAIKDELKQVSRLIVYKN